MYVYPNLSAFVNVNLNFYLTHVLACLNKHLNLNLAKTELLCPSFLTQVTPLLLVPVSGSGKNRPIIQIKTVSYPCFSLSITTQFQFTTIIFGIAFRTHHTSFPFSLPQLLPPESVTIISYL